MFKKSCALLLALLMALSMTSALAEKYQVQEEFQSFDVTLQLPEGAKVETHNEPSLVGMDILFDDASKPAFDLHIAPSEEYDGKSLKELSEEERALLVEQVEMDFSMPQHEFFTTPLGNEILLTRETDPVAGEYATMQTIYHGFFFYLSCAYPDFHALTDADIALMHQITEGVDIIGATK